MTEPLTLLSLLPLLEYTTPTPEAKARYDAAVKAVHPLLYWLPHRLPDWQDSAAFSTWHAEIVKAGTALHACLPDTTPEVYVSRVYHQLRRVSRAGNQYIAQCGPTGQPDSIARDWASDVQFHARTLLLDAHTAIHAGVMRRSPEQDSGPDGMYRCQHGAGLFPCTTCLK